MLQGVRNGEGIVEDVMPLQCRMLDAIIVGKLVAGCLCYVLDRHPRRKHELDRVVKPVRRDTWLNARDIAADSDYLQFVLAPRPETRAFGEAIDPARASFSGIPSVSMIPSVMPVSFVKNGSIA